MALVEPVPSVTPEGGRSLTALRWASPQVVSAQPVLSSRLWPSLPCER